VKNGNCAGHRKARARKIYLTSPLVTLELETCSIPGCYHRPFAKLMSPFSSIFGARRTEHAPARGGDEQTSFANARRTDKSSISFFTMNEKRRFSHHTPDCPIACDSYTNTVVSLPPHTSSSSWNVFFYFFALRPLALLVFLRHLRRGLRPRLVRRGSRTVPVARRRRASSSGQTRRKGRHGGGGSGASRRPAILRAAFLVGRRSVSAACADGQPGSRGTGLGPKTRRFIPKSML
jgi:hypothetical protein